MNIHKRTEMYMVLRRDMLESLFCGSKQCTFRFLFNWPTFRESLQVRAVTNNLSGLGGAGLLQTTFLSPGVDEKFNQIVNKTEFLSVTLQQ